jgi:hypothetical protein
MKNNPFKAVGKSDPNPKETLLESAPESDRWNPVPGSIGHKVPVTPSEDEDTEGRSNDEIMVETGVAAAEQDQSNQANKAAVKKDL